MESDTDNTNGINCNFRINESEKSEFSECSNTESENNSDERVGIIVWNCFIVLNSCLISKKGA